MNNVLFTVVVLLVATIINVLRKFVLSKIDVEKLRTLLNWVNLAVSAAEQLFIGSGLGEDKKEYVFNFIRDYAKKCGITLTDEQLDILIESAVADLNNKK